MTNRVALAQYAEVSPSANKLDYRSSVAALTLAVLVALYTGFRVPNQWSATLDAVSITDGFHRRFVVGTLLRPLALATDYNYWLFATFSFLVLGALLAVLIVNALRTENTAARLVVIGWLLLPTGGFLFHEIGYFEQLLYLLLFASIWLVNRDRLVAATAVMMVTPCIHEIAILTVLPLYGVVLLRRVSPVRAVLATMIPAAVNVALLAIPAASEDAIPTLARALETANFHYRVDALSLFQRSQSENWGLYTVHDVVLYVRPIGYLLVGLLVLVWVSDRHGWQTDRDRVASWVVLLAWIGAIMVPTLLVYGGWDANRWRFIVITNFVLVVWLALVERPSATIPRGTITVMLAVLLLTSRLGLFYFDHLEPREIGYRPLRGFIHQVCNGSLFQRPTDF